MWPDKGIWLGLQQIIDADNKKKHFNKKRPLIKIKGLLNASAALSPKVFNEY